MYIIEIYIMKTKLSVLNTREKLELSLKIKNKIQINKLINLKNW